MEATAKTMVRLPEMFKAIKNDFQRPEVQADFKRWKAEQAAKKGKKNEESNT